MNAGKTLLATALSGAVVATLGCATNPFDEGGWSNVEPDENGLYAYDGDELIRLDGDAAFEKETWGQRSRLFPRSEFVIRDPALEAGDAVVEVRKVAWLRSIVTETGAAMPITGDPWQSVPVPALVAPLEYADPEEPDLVRARARQALEPGLYAIIMDTPHRTRTARFGVEWPELNKRTYAATVCVDRDARAPAGYRLCSEQASADSGKPLEIFLVKPETRQEGEKRSMVISGVIVNNSNRRQTIPVLKAELRDADGQPLADWRFEAANSVLEPGQSTSFRTVPTDPPPETQSVNVNFASAQAPK